MSKGKLLTRFPYDPFVRGAYFKSYKDYNKLRKQKKTSVQTENN